MPGALRPSACWRGCCTCCTRTPWLQVPYRELGCRAGRPAAPARGVRATRTAGRWCSRSCRRSSPRASAWTGRGSSSMPRCRTPERGRKGRSHVPGQGREPLHLAVDALGLPLEVRLAPNEKSVGTCAAARRPRRAGKRPARARGRPRLRRRARAASTRVQWSRVTYPAAACTKTFATSAVLKMSPGLWYYCVRGLNGAQVGTPAMTWSAPVAVKVARPTFQISGR